MMPKRIPRMAMRHPIMTNLILIVLVASAGYWRLDSAVDCNQAVLEADNAAWTRIDALLAQDAGPGTVAELRDAVRNRVQLANDLDDRFC